MSDLTRAGLACELSVRVPPLGDAGRRASMARARGFVDSLAPVLTEIRAEGVTTPSGIACAMTRRGVRRPRGGTVWTAGAVQKLLRTLNDGAHR